MSQVCHFCKQASVKNPFICSGCKNVFHRSCRSKKHKVINMVGDIVTCVGDDPDQMDTESVKSNDSKRSYKRKRSEKEDGENEVSDKLDLLLDRIDDLDTDNDVLKNEIKLYIKTELDAFKKELLDAVSKNVRKELLEMNRGSVNEKVTSDTYSSRVDSYAARLKQSQIESIVVEPKEKQDGAETIKQLKSNIDVGKLGLGVEKIQKTKSGKVIIGCKHKEESCKFVDEIKKNMGKDYNIKINDKKMPKIKIIDIEEDIICKKDDNQIVQMIQRQNDMKLEENIKMEIKKKAVGQKKDGMIILETDPKTHKFLMELNKIKLGWNKCRVYDCVSVLRCYNCWGYHHFAKECRNETKCRKCAGTHKENECTKTENKCINCIKMKVEYKVNDIDENHCANDSNCECYKRIRMKAQKSIRYFSE